MSQGRTIASTLDHLVFLPESDGKSFPTIIAMHGRGADENDLPPVLLALEIPNLLIVTPRAPFALPYGGYVWYDFGQEAMPDQETFRTGIRLLEKFVEEVKAGYPVDPKRLILMGFSQGAMMAYAVGLVNPPQSRGIAALSGYIPQLSNLPLQLHNLAGFPIFISHGENDPVIPVRFGREAEKLLTGAGANVTYREYAMGHEIREETIRDLKQWLTQVLQLP
jgi:phospholipase/carboxylesterase